MAEIRYTADIRIPSNPCRKCGRSFEKGDRIVARSRGRRSVNRGWNENLPTHRYHEECWEKLFL